MPANSSAASRPSSNTSNPAKPASASLASTRLFHWAVPAGREIEAGGEVGRHVILDPLLLARGRAGIRQRQHHGGCPRHGKDRLLAHKAAIDDHLRRCGIPVSYTNVFWGGRSEIKPSEISPFVYREWQVRMAAEGKV